MKAWVKKQAVIDSAKEKGHVAWLLRKWNKAVPCFVTEAYKDITSETKMVRIRIPTDWGAPGHKYSFLMNVPVDSVMFDHRFLKHSFPLALWPRFKELLDELRKFQWEQAELGRR